MNTGESPAGEIREPADETHDPYRFPCVEYRLRASNHPTLILYFPCYLSMSATDQIRSLHLFLLVLYDKLRKNSSKAENIRSKLALGLTTTGLHWSIKLGFPSASIREEAAAANYTSLILKLYHRGTWLLDSPRRRDGSQDTRESAAYPRPFVSARWDGDGSVFKGRRGRDTQLCPYTSSHILIFINRATAAWNSFGVRRAQGRAGYCYCRASGMPQSESKITTFRFKQLSLSPL